MNATGGSGTAPVIAGSSNGAAAGSEPSSGGGPSDTGGTTASGAPSAGGSAPVGAGGSTAGAPPTGSEMTAPEGKLPNSPYTGMENLPKSDWAKGLVSPTLLDKHHIGQSSVVNGYLVVGGNEEFWMFDLSNPKAPKQLSQMLTPNREPTAGPKAEGEAESHTVSFSRSGGKLYMVTTGGHGIDTWDITSATQPKHLAQLKLPGIAYGDFTDAVWGLAWQGQYIYVGSTNNGIDVVDAADPAKPVAVKRVKTSDYGGISAGPLEAVGNVLVVMTPKESNGGMATLDISDPVNPKVMDSLSTNTNSYIGQFYRHYVFMQSNVRAFDVLSNPLSISGALGHIDTTKSEYMSFSDDYMFLGHVRLDAGEGPGAAKISVADPAKMTKVNRIWGRFDPGQLNDDQFTIAIGNLLVMGDDEAPYKGFVIGVHSNAPDSKPPVVDTVIPKNGATGQAVTSRIGVSFSDNVELTTVHPGSFIVRPVGGQPLAGRWGLRMGVVNFDPDGQLLAGTTYEVVLPKGGVKDLVGNAIDQEFKSTFTTK